MTEEPNTEGSASFGKSLNDYLARTFVINEKAASENADLRSAIKWLFDFARNVMIVGVIVFLAKINGSKLLTYLGHAGNGALFTYLMTYADPYLLQPFHPIKNEKVAGMLISASTLS